MSYSGSRYDFHDKHADYARLAQELAALLSGESDSVANAANAAALIFNALQRRTLVVPDVHQFPGHIACDAQSRSEIVVPLIAGGALLGVLDLDSPRPGRLDEADARGLESLADLFLASIRESSGRACRE